MQFASLGSGSKGNATLLKSSSALLMVDCGFTIKETVRRLRRLGHQPEDLSAVLVTHEHGDHIRGVGPLARKYKLPVYCTHGTAHHKGLEGVDLNIINCHQQLMIADLEVEPVAVPHDAREPCQYIFHNRLRSVGLLTDLGSITPHVQARYSCCDALMLEANHDPKMLAMGPYPQSLKLRVGGHWGHLSNQQAANLLEAMDVTRLQHLVISHISEQNNTEELARQAVSAVYDQQDSLYLADQEQGLDWLELA